MAHLTNSELGEIIRKVRKERGLRLEDVADDNISPATISNIERGISHVNTSKTMYLLNKLDLKMEDLPKMIHQQKDSWKKTQFRLQYIESSLDLGDVEKGKDQLDALTLDDSNPYIPTYEYLKGKYYTKLSRWKQAERFYFNAIRLYHQSSLDNIEAASFNDLGVCSYFQNDLEQALQYTESGLHAFQPGNGREYNQYILLCNKAVYLEKLSRIEEANQVVHEVWEDIHKINKIAVVLNLYELRAKLYRKTKMFNQGIAYAKEGIELARINNQYQRGFDLWTVLGDIYLVTQEWEEAEYCFQMALSLKDRFQYNNAVISTYTHYGILYMKQSKWKQAEEMLSQAIQLGEKNDFAFRLTFALMVMGDCQKAQNQIHEAISSYQKSLELAKKYHYENRQRQVLNRLAQCVEGKNQQEFLMYLDNLYQVEKAIQEEEAFHYEELD